MSAIAACNSCQQTACNYLVFNPELGVEPWNNLAISLGHLFVSPCSDPDTVLNLLARSVPSADL